MTRLHRKLSRRREDATDVYRKQQRHCTIADVSRYQKPKSARQLASPIGGCVALALLWPASYFWSEGFIIRPGHRLEMTTGPGWVAFTEGPEAASLKNPPWFKNYFISIDPGRRSALAYTRIYSIPGSRRFYFPLWMLSMATMLIAVASVISHIRQVRNFKPGLCQKCGYDLRASPERCPECGKPAGQFPAFRLWRDRKDLDAAEESVRLRRSIERRLE